MVVESVIPLVDISQDEATAAKQVCRACTEQGFMYVTGHGIPSEQVDAVFAQLKAAFAMPLEAKQAMIADENNRGWTPFAEETLDPERQSKGDTKEGFYFGREVSPDSPEGKLPLHGPNQWPPEDLLPGFRQTITDYFQALTNLGMRMLRLLALSLGLPAEYFDEYFTSPMVALRPLHYSAEVRPRCATAGSDERIADRYSVFFPPCFYRENCLGTAPTQAVLCMGTIVLSAAINWHQPMGQQHDHLVTKLCSSTSGWAHLHCQK
eukprot:GHUV01012012.1.p1 GENE.GHUV01012012.1~~GHUV01012012.1.p1  ORF type:complete len:265 (+),score=49.98 GHUV01012012.1:753-1547(+)